MFEKFMRANAGDFRQRYEGTFGFYRDEKGTRMLAQLTGITESVCTFMDSRGIEYKLYPDSEKDIGFVFLPPKAGYFNTDKGAMMVKRIAARQFQRGVSAKNVSIHLLQGGLLLAHRVNFQTLEPIYNKPTPFSEALEAMFKKQTIPSVALSSQFALDGKSVWVLDEALGSYKREKDSFKVTLNENCPFKTELAEAFAAVSLHAEIS